MKIDEISTLKQWLKGDGSLCIRWDKSNKYLTVTDYRYCRKENKLENPNDPDLNIKRQWGVFSNGAKKGVKEYSCLDWSLNLGHIEINYTDYAFNSKIK